MRRSAEGLAWCGFNREALRSAMRLREAVVVKPFPGPCRRNTCQHGEDRRGLGSAGRSPAGSHRAGKRFRRPILPDRRQTPDPWEAGERTVAVDSRVPRRAPCKAEGFGSRRSTGVGSPTIGRGAVPFLWVSVASLFSVALDVYSSRGHDVLRRRDGGIPIDRERVMSRMKRRSSWFNGLGYDRRKSKGRRLGISRSRPLQVRTPGDSPDVGTASVADDLDVSPTRVRRRSMKSPSSSATASLGSTCPT